MALRLHTDSLALPRALPSLKSSRSFGPCTLTVPPSTSARPVSLETRAPALGRTRANANANASSSGNSSNANSGSCAASSGNGSSSSSRSGSRNVPGKRPDMSTAAVATDRDVSSASTTEVPTALENVVVIGSGPAGYTAAIYAARANLKPLVFEGLSAGGVRGGQLMTTTEVENFPGFPEGITGPDLMDRMRKQAERWGAELFTEDVEFVDVRSRPFTVRTSEREVRCNSIIIATGATARRLGLPNEHTFWSRGISACAICDGASPIFKGQELAVIGGGDTAVEEALYLTKYAKHVHLVVRRSQLRASKAMQDRVMSNANVTVHLEREPVDVVGNDKGQMNGLIIKSPSGEQTILPVRGVFYGIGHKPNSELLAGQVELDESGYVLVREGSVETSVAGVFAAGDLQDTEWRQAITAAASGCMAALSVERFLAANDLLIEFHQKVVEEVEKKELTEEDVEEKYDPSLTRHKGQYALRKLYHESPRVLGVLYTSPTCGPCRTLKPMLSKVIDEYDKDVHWVEIDIVEDPEIAEAAGIMGTPVVQFFKNKEKLAEVTGVKMKSAYREIIEKNIGNKVTAQ